MIQPKYLVVRKDGTIPEWGSFVLSYRDPATPHALNTYAQVAEMQGADPAYVRDLRELAEELSTLPRDHNGDARKQGPDVPAVVRLLNREADLRKLKLADLGLSK